MIPKIRIKTTSFINAYPTDGIAQSYTP